MNRNEQTDTNIKERRLSLDPASTMIVIYVMVIGLIILCGGFMQLEAAETLPKKDTTETSTFSLKDIRQGELLLPDSSGKALPALQLNQDVHIQISGIVARVEVSQVFSNTSSEWVDGVYVFPLPEESAVDRLRMVIGEREIVGEIKEREEAKVIFEKAKEEGKKTSLLAQNRPNIFTTRVANIGPGEQVKVVIEYQQVVRIDDTTFSLRFPMTITPRYIPGNPLRSGEIKETNNNVKEVKRKSISFIGEGWAKNSDRVPDASEITPPMVSSLSNGSGQVPTVQLSVDMKSGFTLARLESLYHQMVVEELSDDHYSLVFNGKVLADRDFVLEWRPEKSDQATAALLSEELGDSRYLLLMLMPPHERVKQYVPREAIYILDVSGSMAGHSIVQAKKALKRALNRLQPADRFNVISFNDSASALYRKPKPANEENIARAIEHLNSLQADGGTEMRSALELALDGSSQRERIRQVVFLTDGAVGNEEELLMLIHNRLGSSRLFTVGIGSAPNSYFMNRAAMAGRGTFTYIGNVNEVQSRMDELLAKLEHPALTNITITANDTEKSELEMESFPHPIPDLYLGEPVIVAVRTNKEKTSFIISGEQLDRAWEYRIETDNNPSRAGVAALWARKKIKSEMDSLALGRQEEQVKKEVLATALEHQLVSKYSSLVAVDKMVSRPGGARNKKEVVKTAAPRGLKMDAIFGGGAKTATPSALHIVVGTFLLMLAVLAQMIRRRIWTR